MIIYYKSFYLPKMTENSRFLALIYVIIHPKLIE